jgi:hypothetical protein
VLLWARETQVAGLPIAAVTAVRAELLSQHPKGDKKDGKNQDLGNLHHHVFTILPPL